MLDFFGLSKRRAAIDAAQKSLNDKLLEADALIEKMRDAPQRFTTIRQQMPGEGYRRWVAALLSDERWQWLVLIHREKLLRQSIEGTRTHTGDRDVYLGAILGLDLLLTDMQRQANDIQESATHGDDEQA